MPVLKLEMRPGINRERTSYANEGAWFDCDKVRFRQGFPEKIGGWQRISGDTFLGVCRSLWNWRTLENKNLLGVGTHLKFYIESGGVYFDITPIRATTVAADVTFSATDGSSVVTVADTNHGAIEGDYVVFSSAVSLGGAITDAVINGEHRIASVPDPDSYTVDFGVAANASDTGNGSGVVAAYQINIGGEFGAPLTGWGAGGWGTGTWGSSPSSTASSEQLRIWSQRNFGEDLIFGYSGGPIYFWDATLDVTTRGTLLSAESGASDVPTTQRLLRVSDNRFVMCFGVNPLGSGVLDPMLIRWSDQEDATNWTPAATNQAGSLPLSRGSEIVTAVQARQEYLVWTDSALYSLQYLGAPDGWGAQLVGENTSIVSMNAVTYVNGFAYWMGKGSFYQYDGRVTPLRCDVRRYVFNDFNKDQNVQVFSGANNAFNEVWWFYCSADSTVVDRYVVYNYVEDIWFYGMLARTAWNDVGSPIAATYNGALVSHEVGLDDAETDTPTAIPAYITSTQVDLEDGDKFMLVRRALPDITFAGSTADNPNAMLTIYPSRNSGSGRTSPGSEGGTDTADVIRSATAPIEAYTGQVFIRVRGRQIAMKVESDAPGVAWQLGAMRVDARPDGRR